MPFNALFLLRHAAVHFAAVNIGLRHVLDWYVFIERNAGKIGWEELYALAREANMDRFLGCLNAICVEELGLDPSLLPPFTVDPKLKERVLNEILSPEFSAPKPTGLLPNMWFKTRRWWANRWKHRDRLRRGACRSFRELRAGAPETSEIHPPHKTTGAGMTGPASFTAQSFS